jgi:hypothetical protein
MVRHPCSKFQASKPGNSEYTDRTSARMPEAFCLSPSAAARRRRGKGGGGKWEGGEGLGRARGSHMALQQAINRRG